MLSGLTSEPARTPQVSKFLSVFDFAIFMKFSINVVDCKEKQLSDKKQTDPATHYYHTPFFSLTTIIYKGIIYHKMETKQNNRQRLIHSTHFKSSERFLIAKLPKDVKHKEQGC